MKEIGKFALRFGLLAMALYSAYVFTLRPDDVFRILYKGSVAVAGFALGEIVWLIFYKVVYKATEDMTVEEKKAILTFRGIIVGSFILGLCLGL